MPFRSILGSMIGSVDGAVAAMFLDQEGEAVEVVGRAGSPDELKIVGAYQSIFLARLRDLCSTLDHGEPERFTIDHGDWRIMSVVLNHDYYVVLLLDDTAVEGLAWRALFACRDRLLQEV